MELKQLKFFMVASDCGSLSKAATKLYTSQPNVSKVIKSLEKELGSPLFERTSRGLRLTPYGKSIYGYAENVLKNAIRITPRKKWIPWNIKDYLAPHKYMPLFSQSQ
jgi:DNA-binding transcriptional LysR family regulator